MAKRRTAAVDEIADRKQAHLDLCLREDVQAATKTTLLEEVQLVHDALPDLALDDIDTSTKWLGKKLAAPLVITGMTGGTKAAFEVNRDLARVAEETGIAFGVGSQRAMQSRPNSGWTYQVREYAPSTVVLANIGIGQAREMELAQFQELIDALQADALCLHLNVAQEMIQPEGDRSFTDGTKVFRRLVRKLGTPVIAKETGCGISRQVGERLAAAGVRHVDVSGAGGTSWVRIEALRAPKAERLGALYRDWGVPTAASLLQLRSTKLQLIASGGIRSGLDVARALALGAQLAGTALPVYQAYQEGGIDGAREFVGELVRELKVAMLLTGNRTLAEMRRADAVLGPRLLAWQPKAGSTRRKR
ncbi:MAG: type 2 isopentenyl-diphosphate Delta-isomerase [Candidatus Binatia bacterium]|nr:type 2 isopentenyl-diphosphate Delta-isomerase [Candidatus Binatia bacterium]